MTYDELINSINSEEFRKDYDTWYLLVNSIKNVYKIPIQINPPDRVQCNMGIINGKPFIESMDYEKTKTQKPRDIQIFGYWKRMAQAN